MECRDAVTQRVRVNTWRFDVVPHSRCPVLLREAAPLAQRLLGVSTPPPDPDLYVLLTLLADTFTHNLRAKDLDYTKNFMCKGGISDESCNLAARNVYPGPRGDGSLLPVYGSVRENLNDEVVNHDLCDRSGSSVPVRVSGRGPYQAGMVLTACGSTY